MTGISAALPRMILRKFSNVPVRVQVHKHRKTSGQLKAEEHGRLRVRNGARGDRAALGAFWCQLGSLYVPTFASILASHMSLIVHPAPRMIHEPAPNSARFVSQTETGAPVKCDASVIDQVHGRNKSQEPIGRSTRASSINGLIENFFGSGTLGSAALALVGAFLSNTRREVARQRAASDRGCMVAWLGRVMLQYSGVARTVHACAERRNGVYDAIRSGRVTILPDAVSGCQQTKICARPPAAVNRNWSKFSQNAKSPPRQIGSKRRKRSLHRDYVT